MPLTAATAATGPGPDGSGPVATADDVITLADLQAWERQFASSGACSHPICLHGRIDAIDRATGETARVYDTAASRVACCMSRAATAANRSARASGSTTYGTRARPWPPNAVVCLTELSPGAA